MVLVDPSLTLVVGVAITTVGWLVTTFLTQPADEATLRAFHAKIRPLGGGWRAVVGDQEQDSKESISAPLLGWFLGCVLVYGALFGTGMLLYGRMVAGSIAIIVAVGAAIGMFRLLPHIRFMDPVVTED